MLSQPAEPLGRGELVPEGSSVLDVKAEGGLKAVPTRGQRAAARKLLVFSASQDLVVSCTAKNEVSR